MFDKIVEYLKYPSTKQGIVGVLALAGVHFSPENIEVILNAAGGLIAAIAIFCSDSDVKVKK